MKCRPSSVVSYRNSTSNHNFAVYSVTLLWVVSYRNSTSNHNNFEKRTGNFLLYLIEILHQTTTYTVGTSTFVVLYLIEILHQTTTLELEMSAQQRCILSKFYIKPQLRCILGYTALGCILSKFYIKPQQLREAHWELFRCILSKFYIKPQLRFTLFFQFIVVSYRNSTSNHNFTPRVDYSQGVVSYRNSTSNHNSLVPRLNVRIVVSYRNSTSNHNSFAE